MDKIPKVSIGLPVFNGGQYLEQSIQSILTQSFDDFELIICDNASSDTTAEICRSYQSKDRRIRYHRNDTNLGGANNANLTFHLSRGKYFRWAAHDDICAPQLLEKCVEVLDHDASVVLSHGQTLKINDVGEIIGKTSSRLGESNSPHQRFLEIADRAHHCDMIYGLYRSDILRSSCLHKNYTDSDRTLLCELGLHGKFLQVQEPLYYKRYHQKNQYHDWRTRMAWFDDRYVGKIVFPNWIQLYDFFVVINRAPLPMKEKICCYFNVVGPIAFRNSRELFYDLKFMIVMGIHSDDWRKKRYAETKGW
jgi:glycosyltransferase involved in cell wall biosynthesis